MILNSGWKLPEDHFKVNNQKNQKTKKKTQPITMEAKSKPDFSGENLAHYKIEFHSFGLSATHEKEGLQERKKSCTFPRNTTV